MHKTHNTNIERLIKGIETLKTQNQALTDKNQQLHAKLREYENSFNQRMELKQIETAILKYHHRKDEQEARLRNEIRELREHVKSLQNQIDERNEESDENEMDVMQEKTRNQILQLIKQLNG
ncbi:hypothetical protein O9G_005134 [Rozella allomycis CSF55]|uniref:Uncharacterized protein n=1 Tax=Rozella allomycis (strain CSF55) TaxID=988480 RepID=A0A075B3T3_ROZAC|nr:hypothetical protein O9G_005134 [Rozella allomycis CSF55]|eukprot:EPZ35568.1 hypothetical protein O9G_005134 [Rozella allomycis CSF55]